MLNNYDDIVIGTGLVGCGVSNLLAQKGRSVLNIGSPNNAPVQNLNASLKYQGWLISGVSWYFEPYGEVLNNYYRESIRIREFLKSSQKFFPNFKPRSESLLILDSDQLGNLENSRIPSALYNKIKSNDEIHRLSGNNKKEGLHYFKVLDRTYESCMLMNAMIDYSKSESVDVEFTELNQNNFKVNGKIIFISIDSNWIQSENIYVCAGANTGKILNFIDNTYDANFQEDLSLPSRFEQKQKMIVQRTPLVSYNNNNNIEADVIIDLPNKISIAKHFTKKNLVATTYDFTESYNPLENFAGINDINNTNGLKESINKLFPSLTARASWMCNRIERKIRYSNSKIWLPTISNWAGQWERNDNVIFSISSKGTLSLDTAFKMVKTKHPNTINKFQLNFDYKNDTFQCQFNLD